jgi:hypothetical protein
LARLELVSGYKDWMIRKADENRHSAFETTFMKRV